MLSHSDKISPLKYDSLQISKSLNSVSERYQIDARFSLVAPITFRKGRSKNQIILDRMVLLNSTCEIKFVKENGTSKRFTLIAFDETMLHSNVTTIFSIIVDPQDIEQLNNWISGELVYLHWLIKGYIIPLEGNQVLNPQYIEINNWIDDPKPSISYNNFVSTFLNPLNLGSIYYTKFPIVISESIDQFKDSDDEIWSLIIDIKTLISHLQSAVVLLRKANNNQDYIEILDTVKQSVDKIRKFCKEGNNLASFGDKLLIKSGIIYKAELDSDEKTAALEHMKYFFCILENLYQISSKARHTTLRERNKGDTHKGFRMRPDRDEAIFVTEVGLTAAKYLISKIDIYLTRTKALAEK